MSGWVEIPIVNVEGTLTRMFFLERALVRSISIVMSGGTSALDTLDRKLSRVKSVRAQYAALAIYVAVKVVIFVPLLYQADRFAPGALAAAAQATLIGFAGLSWIRARTRDSGPIR